MLKYTLLLITLLILPSLGIAQIQGIIVDERNAPLEYATAALYNQNDSSLVAGVVSEHDGSFKIENLKRGSYYLEASFIGYEINTIEDITIKNRKDSKNLNSIQLTLGNHLSEVVVVGERATVINKIDRQVFLAEKFKSAQGGTGIDVLRNLPSVSIDGLGEISVRGSTGFVVLLNGTPVQGNASSFISQLPANGIERVEIITAPSAKYDPEGKAGIINILTKKGVGNGSFGQINVRGGLPSIETYGNDKVHQRYGIDGTYTWHQDKWNVSLGGSYQRNDLGGRREGDVFTIINDTKTIFPSTGERSFDEINYSGRFTVDYVSDINNTFSLGFFAGERSKDRLADIVYYDNHSITPADGDDINDRDYTFQYYNHNLRERKSDFALGSLDYKHIFENTSAISTSILYEYSLLGGPTVNQNLGYANNKILYDVLYQDEYNTNDNPLHGVRFQLDYQFKPFEFGTLETGYQFRNLDHKGDFIYERRTDFNEEFELVPDFSSEVNLKRSIHSVYGQFTGNSGNWDYAAGARVEKMDRTLDLGNKTDSYSETFIYDFFKVFPSASVQYSINDKTNLKAAYSKRIERTTTFKMNPFAEREHSETLEMGDATLKPEFIDLVELGVTRNLNGGNSIYATVYYTDVKNFVNRVNTIYNDSILNRIYSNIGTARSIGLEVGAQLKPTKNWTNFIGANIYDHRIKGEYDNRPINSSAIVYSINLNSTYSFWKNASLQFTFNYLSERITAQGEDSRFYSPNLTFQKSFLDDRLTATIQWQNIDMGFLDSNEQRITTYRPNEFFTTTNYIYEVDVVVLNLTYTFKNGKGKSKFIESVFSKQEF